MPRDSSQMNSGIVEMAWSDEPRLVRSNMMATPDAMMSGPPMIASIAMPRGTSLDRYRRCQGAVRFRSQRKSRAPTEASAPAIAAFSRALASFREDSG